MKSITPGNMKRLFAGFLILFLFYTSPATAEQNQRGMLSVFDLNAGYLEDQAGRLSVADILNLQEKSFLKFDREVLNAGRSTSVYWIRLAIPGSDDADRVLTLLKPSLDRVDFYLVKDGVVTDHSAQGNMVKGSGSDKRVFYFSLPPTKTGQTIYLRFETLNSIIIGPTLQPRETFLTRIASENMLYGLYFGLLTAMALYNFFMFLSFRDNNYLIFILFLGFFGVFQLNYTGFFRAWFWWQYNPWNHQIILSLVVSSSILMLLFFRSFLEIPRRQPLISKGAWLIFGLLASSFFLMIKPSPTVYLFVGALINLVVVYTLVFSARALYLGYRPARYFMLASCFVLVGSSTLVLTLDGHLPYNFLTANAQILGSAFQVILFSFSLTDRINVLRLERQKMQVKNEKALREKLEVLEYAQKLEEDKKKAEIEKEKAQAASIAKNEFLANVSHELQTPLNTILGFSELLDTMVKDKKQKEYLDSIRTSGGSLSTLINDILDLSRMEAGKLEIQSQPVMLRPMLREISDVFALQLAQKNLKLSIYIDSELPEILFLDEIRLRQILFNLVGNAIKNTENGSIKISVQDRIINTGDEVDLIIVVEDTGIGIPAEYQSNVFEPYFLQDNRDFIKHGSNGLGLFLCKRLVEEMNGTVTLKSEVGRGSSFEIRFFQVAISSLDKSMEMESVLQVERVAFSPASILVVDDIELNQKLLTEYLNLYSTLKVITAGNGQEALLTAKEHVPDLILIDLKLPVMNGYEATQLIKSDKNLKHIPVIALSVSTNETEEMLIANYGFNGFLPKPVSRKRLVNKLSQYLEFEYLEAELSKSS